VDEAEFRREVNRSDSNRVRLEPGGSCNVIIRLELGVYGLSSTPTRFLPYPLYCQQVDRSRVGKRGQ